MTSDPQSSRHGNGLSADNYVPLADVDAEVAEELLVVLRRARIAAYIQSAAGAPMRRLFVASADRADARTVAEAAAHGRLVPLDPLEGVDTDAEFDALVEGWDIDTISAVRSAERDLTREDAEWRARLEPGFPNTSAADDEEHYVPPAPPPLPRLAAATILALVIIAASIVVLAVGYRFGLDSDVAFLLGVGGILTGTGMLIMRLRARPSDDDDGDDGAIV